MLNLRDIGELERLRKAREAAARLQQRQRAESVMMRPGEQWEPDYRRPGGHALEAPMLAQNARGSRTKSGGGA
jgi:hypothetical protein